MDQLTGSDIAFLPSTGADLSPFLPSSAQDNNEIFAFNTGVGGTNNPEGLSFALSPGTDGFGDTGSFSSLDGGPNEGIFASLSGQNTENSQDWTA